MSKIKGEGPAPSTLSDVFNGKSVPSRHTLRALLKACGVDEAGQQPWLAAYERVSTAGLRRPAGAVRVRDADPRRLGVHASIQVEAGADDLPTYVPRDFDAELRTAVTVASRAGGMVLLSGGSSVGKTRALCETARAVLPEWWLLHPVDAARVRAFAQTPAPRTVVWLDELQRYLDQPEGLPAGLIRDLLAAGTVVLATLWPDEVATRSAPRVPGEQDRHAEDREVLKLARIIDVPAAFSPAEWNRAEQLAGDGRIRIALQHADPGVTQVLAAGPELIRRWQHAPTSQCYGQAVITWLCLRVVTPAAREFCFH
ncbi:helix-turn-helix domain-containing protein [Actinoplanes xinjiangensis]|uniref:helix-turn-helix domain-containing protein n=1 Tax=Actinoplanes xinjiangensis TaxID=512350 RepID=UPI003424D07E